MNMYSKYSSLKHTIEDLFGVNAWYELKETDSITVWKKYIIKTLKAIQISIHQTVKIYDAEWLLEVDDIINKGIDSAKKTDSIDELISVLAGTMINVSFQQVGHMPRRKRSDLNITLKKNNWNFNSYRSVMYVQSPEQKEYRFWCQQQEQMGFEKQLEIKAKYEKNRSKLTYSEWCNTNETST
jgi:hypothetical protein